MENDTVDFPDEHVIIGDDAFSFRLNLKNLYIKYNFCNFWLRISFNFTIINFRKSLFLYILVIKSNQI